MPRAVEKASVYEPLSVNAVPVAVPVGGPPVATATPVLYPGAPVVEGKIERQVAINRDCKDVMWAVIFGVGLLAALGSGIFEVSSVNSLGTNLKKCDTFKSTPQYNAMHIAEKESEDASNNITDIGTAAPEAAGALIVVIAAAVLVAVFYLFALEAHARTVTWACICLWPMVMAAAGLYFFSQMSANDKANGTENSNPACALGNCQIQAVVCVVFSLVFLVWIWCRRAQVELTARLLSMSATAFKQNLSLIWTTSLTNFVISILVSSPLWLMLCISAMPEDVSLMIAGCPGCKFSWSNTSTDPDGIGMFTSVCPDVKPLAPNMAILALLAFMGIWVQMLSMEIRVANVAGAIGLHYFEQDINGTNRSVQSMKWALGSNFGSLCYCSFVLTVVEIIDYLVNRMLENARRGGAIAFTTNRVQRDLLFYLLSVSQLVIVAEILACLWRCVEVYIQFLTKMAVIALSVTGAAFCESAKSANELLMRHNLDGFVVDVFAGTVLNLFAFAIMILFGFTTYGVASFGTNNDDMRVVLAIVAAIVAFVTLKCVAGIVLVVCDTHYMCYVLDLDNNFAPCATTQQIHTLYKEAIDHRMGQLRSNPKVWASTGPGKREAAAKAGGAAQAPRRI